MFEKAPMIDKFFLGVYFSGQNVVRFPLFTMNNHHFLHAGTNLRILFSPLPLKHPESGVGITQFYMQKWTAKAGSCVLHLKK